MKVILMKDVDKLGKEDDVKEVKPGFARNYLFPNKLAVLATEQNVSVLKQEKETLKKRMEKEEKALQETVDKLSKATSVNINVKVGESGKLFGSVTKDDLLTAIKAEIGVDIGKTDIMFEDTIKETGVYSVPVKIKSSNYPEKISKLANIKVWVVEEGKKK